VIEKLVPQRMCVVCRKMFNKSDLVRVVKNSEGNVCVDLAGKASGRGAWVCKNDECLNKLKKNKSLNRAFSCQINEDVYNKVLEVAKNGNKQSS